MNVQNNKPVWPYAPGCYWLLEGCLFLPIVLIALSLTIETLNSLKIQLRSCIHSYKFCTFLLISNRVTHSGFQRVAFTAASVKGLNQWDWSSQYCCHWRKSLSAPCYPVHKPFSFSVFCNVCHDLKKPIGNPCLKWNAFVMGIIPWFGSFYASVVIYFKAETISMKYLSIHDLYFPWMGSVMPFWG